VRVGTGFDVHPFELGRRLILGGTLFEGETGLAGHSDGDALTHAIIDALLGAAALGDIGSHFPSDNERLHNADSLELLKQVVKLIAASGCHIVNVDATVIARSPRMAPRVAEMRRRLASALAIDLGGVSIKATTTDGLGFIGRGEGIAVQAIVLLEDA
jgi:2-C-methyl-D-erythritol 2,4-cyclodiphosphate synthase